MWVGLSMRSYFKNAQQADSWENHFPVVLHQRVRTLTEWIELMVLIGMKWVSCIPAGFICAVHTLQCFSNPKHSVDKMFARAVTNFREIWLSFSCLQWLLLYRDLILHLWISSMTSLLTSSIVTELVCTNSTGDIITYQLFESTSSSSCNPSGYDVAFCCFWWWYTTALDLCPTQWSYSCSFLDLCQQVSSLREVVHDSIWRGHWKTSVVQSVLTLSRTSYHRCSPKISILLKVEGA